MQSFYIYNYQFQPTYSKQCTSFCTSSHSTGLKSGAMWAIRVNKHVCGRSLKRCVLSARAQHSAGRIYLKTSGVHDDSFIPKAVMWAIISHSFWEIRPRQLILRLIRAVDTLTVTNNAVLVINVASSSQELNLTWSSVVNCVWLNT